MLISGCGQENLNKPHKQYLSDKGWEIKKAIEAETYTLEIPNEILGNYEASGITFFDEYLGETVTEYTYELKEQDAGGKRLKAIIFESENEIIGGYGVLPSWTPGRFNLDEKQRLLEEKMIK